MSKNEQTPGIKDVFSVYQESIDKIFTGIRQSVPQYHQSITNVQQEYLQAYENVVDSSGNKLYVYYANYNSSAIISNYVTFDIFISSGVPGVPTLFTITPNSATVSQAAFTWTAPVTKGISNPSSTVAISNYNITYVPGTLTVSASVLSGATTAGVFTTTYGIPSVSQSFPISGSNLIGDIIATAPTGFEISFKTKL